MRKGKKEEEKQHPWSSETTTLYQCAFIADTRIFSLHLDFFFAFDLITNMLELRGL